MKKCPRIFADFVFLELTKLVENTNRRYKIFIQNVADWNTLKCTFCCCCYIPGAVVSLVCGSTWQEIGINVIQVC